MAVNDATIALITKFEGFVDHWYPDPAHGWKVPTAVIGHTDAAGEPKYAATKTKKFTKAEGEAILRKDLEAVEASVANAVTVPLNENQYGALVSFTFNLGSGNFRKSTLLKKVNVKDWAGAAGEFGKWNRAAGKVMKGLTTRRAAEAELFLKPAPGKIQPKPEAPVEDFETPISPPPDYGPSGGVSWLWVGIGIIAVLMILAAIFWRF